MMTIIDTNYNDEFPSGLYWLEDEEGFEPVFYSGEQGHVILFGGMCLDENDDYFEGKSWQLIDTPDSPCSNRGCEYYN